MNGKIIYYDVILLILRNLNSNRKNLISNLYEKISVTPLNASNIYDKMVLLNHPKLMQGEVSLFDL